MPVFPQQQSGNMEEINDLVDNKLNEKRTNENVGRQLSFEMNETSDHYLEKNSTSRNGAPAKGTGCKRMVKMILKSFRLIFKRGEKGGYGLRCRNGHRDC